MAKCGRIVPVEDLGVQLPGVPAADRFDEINTKIENLRSTIKIKPKVEIPSLSPSPPEKGKKRVRKPSVPKKTEAEERIEEIRAEVEKVLERLGQIEVEA